MYVRIKISDNILGSEGLTEACFVLYVDAHLMFVGLLISGILVPHPWKSCSFFSL